ncbi:MAG: T9SS type A sorting domain-containing protein [Ignavibacteriales bacterium]|nr:MAG: T9SS type A sorting domain-containing protein [Ignavibacteriaceae bacterium]MBW7872360.1 T9SS type A sorting domain-containing protein [Ignavibacteria bacterium]MCZ2142643.1 T9SS type A sorting domain-containing protein [Ignavibacteriales bacterium]MBV6445494.1 hypothetical protein [Ignavibacteriaceae bacterium]MBZ0197682.1 T9SS type A sorting domain-containing protein [Ignavibacteriaceae bacterium]
MMKRALTLCVIFFVAVTTGYSQIFTENFNYPIGDSVSAHGNWVAHSGAGSSNILVGEGIEMAGYPLSGGGAAYIYNNGQDINRVFDSVTTGSVYASFLIKVTAQPSVAGYFFHFGHSVPMNTFDFRARTWIKTSNAGFQLGLSFATNTQVYYNTDLNLDQVYVVVVKYKIIDGAANDEVSLYVFAQGDNFSTEPGTPAVGPLVADGTEISVGAVALRQFNASEKVIFDNLIVSTDWPAGVVPVEFSSFAANSVDGKVNLTWTTASETNNRGFDVERSSDNVNFQSIGFVNGKGTSTSTNAYSFVDEKAANGTLYYRLKQVDFDGTTAYSNTVEVSNEIVTGFQLKQNYPNPFNPSTTIKFSVDQVGIATLNVYNVTGELVAQLFNNNAEPGTLYSVNFDGSNLTSGVYFARLTQGNTSQNIKLILNK